MNPFAMIFGPVIKVAGQLGSMWMQGKQQKHAAKMAHLGQVVQGKIDYNTAAQKGMAASIKDEILTIWFITIMTMNFIPSMQPYMEEGWRFMKANTPDWFAFCFIGIVVATFGLKGWAGIKGVMNGSQG